MSFPAEFNWDTQPIWVYQATFTQTSAGGGLIDVRISPGAGNQLLLLNGMTGADDYSANETVDVSLISNSQILGYFRPQDTAVDNLLLAFPFIGATKAAASGTWNPLSADFVLQGGEELRIVTSALAQNETLKVRVRFKILSKIGTISTAGSGGTVTTTETTNKII